MKIQTIDRANLRTLQTEALAALQAVAAKYGVTIKMGRGVYSNGGTGKLGFEVETEAGGAQVLNLAKSQAARLQVDISGVSSDGYTVTGYNLNAPRKPWQITKGGRQYTAPDGWMMQPGRWPMAKAEPAKGAKAA